MYILPFKSSLKKRYPFDKMKKYLILTYIILCTAGFTFGQTRTPFIADEEMLGQIDTNTLKLYSKLYPQVSAGDLNVYGFDENDVPIYADSVYAYRLSLLESRIPLDYNPYVRPYIDLYTIKRRKLAAKVLSWSKLYFPGFEQALDNAGMPVELKYLAVIESALNPMATSPVGAAGMWQFMAPTGRIYGLKTSAHYDERRDVQKSTEAAIKYLANSYRIYGDWLLVIASYNCGPGNVNKAIRKAGGVKNFWAVQQYLPRETRGYVPAFIAAAYLMNYSSEHNIYPDESISINYHTDTVLVDNRYNLNSLADILGMDVEEIKSFNPAIRKGVLPFNNAAVAITLPYKKAQLFAQMQANPDFKAQQDSELIALNNFKPVRDEIQLNPKGKKIYRVKKGDNLAEIADEFDVTVSDLKKWNHIRGRKIKAGQRLKISRA